MKIETVDAKFFKQAYQQVMKGIVADLVQVEAMMDDLAGTFMKCNRRVERQIVRRYLPDGEWRWPAYEAQLVEWRKTIPRYMPDETPEEDAEDGLDYNDMIEKLCHRIAMLALLIRRKEQMKESVRIGSTWEFMALSNPTTWPECLARHGNRYSHDNPIWDKLPPCDNVMCGCGIRLILKWNETDSSAR